MTLAAPEWLTRRGGSLKPGSSDFACYMMLNGEPLYAIAPVPVAGKFGCAILQTNSGKRLETNTTTASAEEAFRVGLETVRKALGW